MKMNDAVSPGRRGIFSVDPGRDKFYGLHFFISLGLAALLLFFLGPGAVAVKRNFEGLSPGVIADRDITAGKDVVYVDAEATRLRIDAEERLVLPVFQLDTNISKRMLDQFDSFSTSFREFVDQDIALETGILMLQSKFPGTLSRETLLALANSSLKAQALVYAESILGAILGNGVFSLPSEGLSRFNQDYFELRRLVNDKTELEQRPRASMVTENDVVRRIDEEISQKHLARPLSGIVEGLVSGFIAENVFFDETTSLTRLRKVSAKVDPVTRAVGKNEFLIRKGEMVTDESFARLQAIRSAVSRSDISISMRSLGILLASASLGFFLLRKKDEEYGAVGTSGVLMCVYSALVFYFIVLLASRTSVGDFPFEGAYMIPVALFTGIAAALAGQRFAFSFSIVLGMLATSASNLNPYYIVFVIFAGVFATFMISTAKTRINLVLAAVFQAVIQFFLALILLMQQGLRFNELFAFSGYLALSGFISCALILAILPVLEQSFNLPTRFRLLELSDVNSPALKELLTQAPGTYSHSMSVAHLAEAAAEDIGANPLLARVGAYYHDIGKIEQAEYFVENQRGVNKHDDINPRLSATVIRSHVKIGVEKARELKLPKAVVDIIAQHHGNSVIAWFYDKAKRADDSIRKEDFSYPGFPPANKEAGIVMLADAVEASTRTLKKPSVPRLDAHVHQLILDKIQEGQLDECELTLKDLEVIRHSFVRIMAGQFHSRIEYPKQKEQGQ
ncbi:MAG TPA: HDIG domain-containing protein [Rectinemataceae bacterium]|nr:HDIG domain-containing protein [Rectinemataceae bacterium]